MTATPLPHNALEVVGLSLRAVSYRGETRPVTDATFTVPGAGSLAIVGESGSGKSLTLRAILGLLPAGVAHDRGEVRYGDGGAPAELLNPELLRGRGLAYVPQEPTLAMNPTMRLADLVASGPLARGATAREAREIAINLLGDVGIPAPRERADAWPHELSGGMRQRAMIAMALATEPRILLCDEPTTALDVTVQAQIVQLLMTIREQRRLALVFVTHDLALASQLCDDVAVMYAGRVIETGRTAEVLASPAHRYTAALVRAVPDPTRRLENLATIAGQPPSPEEFVDGCRFAPRCDAATSRCTDTAHTMVSVTGAAGRRTACIDPPGPSS